MEAETPDSDSISFTEEVASFRASVSCGDQTALLRDARLWRIMGFQYVAI